jgi:hypothetical protein
MCITRDIVETKLSGFSIPYGHCGSKAFQIAGILLNQQIDPFPGTRYSSLNEALAAISCALAHRKLVIMWLDTGLLTQTCRAIHCFFVYQDNPLQSFSIWDKPGPEFYDDNDTRYRMNDTIHRNQNFGGIELHFAPPP